MNNSIKNVFKRNRKNLLFVFFVLVSLIMMTVSNKSASLTARQVLFSIVYPFQFSFHSVVSFFQNTFNSINELKEIKEELDKTKKELDQYKKVIIDFNELNNENSNLKKMLDLKQSISYDSVPAEVIGRDPQKLFDILIINKGSNSGIKENMPVIGYSFGKRVLVGKIVEVTPFASKILTVTNVNFSAGAITSKDKIHCIVKWSNEIPGVVKLLYIPKQYIIPDTGIEYIYTSGDSLIFPKGIEIGKIIKINPSQRYEIFNEGLVQLSVDISKLDYVLVLKVESDKDNYKILEIMN